MRQPTSTGRNDGRPALAVCCGLCSLRPQDGLTDLYDDEDEDDDDDNNDHSGPHDTGTDHDDTLDDEESGDSDDDSPGLLASIGASDPAAALLRHSLHDLLKLEQPAQGVPSVVGTLFFFFFVCLLLFFFDGGALRCVH